MYRKEALEYKRRNWQGKVILTSGIPVWFAVSATLFFIGFFVISIMCGSYTRRINVSGEVTTFPRPVNVYSGVEGFIVEQFVQPGQLIRRGDPIYRIDVSKSTNKGVISENIRADTEKQIARVDDIITRLKSSKATTLNTLRKQKEQYINAYSRSSEIIGKAQKGIQFLQKNMENYREYQSRGLITRDQFTNQVAMYYQQQNNFLGLSGQNEQNALQITSLESQALTQSAEFDNQIYQMELQKYELQKELVSTDGGKEILVRSSSDGKVDSLSVTVGQMVMTGDSLLQILPKDNKGYFLVLWVPNDAVPYIRAGDKMNIRYEAFPAEKFGQFSATISEVSRTPASTKEMLTYQGAPGGIQTITVPWYKVTVRPDKQYVAYNDSLLPLENGMKAEGTLFLENRRIYQWMFTPVYHIQHSVTGPVDND